MTNVRLRVPLVTIAIGAIALYVFAQWTARQGAEDQRIIQAAEHALASGKAYRGRIAKLAAASRAHADTARTRQVLIPIVTPAMTTTEIRGVAIDWQRVARQWELAFRAESTRAVVAEGRVAELERHLAQVLTVADCRMLGIEFLPRCPGRTTAFVLGAGAASVVLLARGK